MSVGGIARGGDEGVAPGKGERSHDDLLRVRRSGPSLATKGRGRPRVARGVGAGVLLSLLAGVAPPARGADVRILGIGSSLATSAPALDKLAPGESPIGHLDLGLVLKLDVRNVGGRADFKLDLWARYALVSPAGARLDQQLRTASVTVRDLLGKRLDVTLGRFHTPGGFWLIADGAQLRIRYADWLDQLVYGGLRAFTTGRRNADLTFDDPQALPLVGTSLRMRLRHVDAQVTATWARDSIDQFTLLRDRGDAASGERPDRYLEDELFLDAQVGVFPHERIAIFGGLRAGSRYDVQFDATNPVGAVTIANEVIGSAGAYLFAEYRPLDRLRLQYTFNFDRMRLIQSELLARKPDGTPVRAANGSFQDHQVRGSLLLVPARALRGEAQYRIRFRENTDIEHHATVSLRGDDLVFGLGAFASVGVDVFQPGVTPLTTRLVYAGGLSFVRPWLDLRAGVLFTDGFGSGFTFSQRQSAAMGGGMGTAPTELFPYTLESNRVAYLRAFVMLQNVFVGLDVEENLDRVQLRGMLQVGGVR